MFFLSFTNICSDEPSATSYFAFTIHIDNVRIGNASVGWCSEARRNLSGIVGDPGCVSHLCHLNGQISTNHNPSNGA